MRCTNCGLIIPYNKAPSLTHCSLCGTEMSPDIRDILEFGKFNITKEVRPAQIELGQDIERILRTANSTLFAEGGTGIGKSFAYLIPALFATDKRVIISTAKKALQDQLATKDIPHLLPRMGIPNFDFCVYKGKTNYACWLLAREVPTHERRKFEEFINAAKTAECPADIAGWDNTDPTWWPKVSIDNCVLKTNCVHYKHCRPHPGASNLVITNHHLMAIDTRATPGMLFGEYDVLIMDEGHQAPTAFRSAHSCSVTFRGIDTLVGKINNDEHLRTAINDGGHTTAKSFTKAIQKIRTSFKTLHKEAGHHSDSTGAWDPAKTTDEIESLHDASTKCVRTLVTLQEHLTRGYYSEDLDKDFKLAMAGRASRIHKQVTNIMTLMEGLLLTGDKKKKNTGTHRPWLSVQNEKGIQLQPVDLGEVVGPALRKIPHKIIISATLAMGDDFSFTREKFGMRTERTHVTRPDGTTEIIPPDDITEKVYQSSFKLDEQAVLYIPRHLPLPAHPGNPEQRKHWISQLSQEIARLLIATSGDSFVLFSAKADMKETLDNLSSGFWAATKLKLVLHDGDATATLEKYKKTPRGVLFGLKSFWEGVDVPGKKLKMVIIPKLPFPNPKDPLISALSKDAGRQSFNTVMLPHMFFDMKQGVGRLIRTQNDRGFIVILDPRIWTGTGNPERHEARMKFISTDPQRKRMGYGKQLLTLLGYTQITDDFTIFKRSVKNFFNEC